MSTSTLTLGSLNLNDRLVYMLESERSGSGLGINPAAWRREGGMLEIPLLILGSNQKGIETRRRAIISVLNDAESAWRDGRASDRVALTVDLRSGDTVRFIVRDGVVDPLRWHSSGKFGWVTLRLRCEALNGRAVAYLEEDAREASSTLSNGAGVVLIEDIGGDYPAGVRIVLTDESDSGVINLWRLSAVSAADLALGDWDPWVDILNSGSSNQSDGGAYGENYERVSLATRSAWTYLGTASMPAGAMNRGMFGVRARVFDSATVLAAPTLLSAAESTLFPRVRQAESAANASAADSIAAAWTSATQAGSTLVAILKATKTSTKFNITGAVNDGTNLGETTITTAVAHGFANGDRVLIEGVSAHQPDINGTWAVSRVTSTTFNITIATTNSDESSFGTVHETFFEEIDSVPSGYVLLESRFTDEGSGQISELIRSPSGRPIRVDADTVELTRYWLYVNPAASSASSTQTFEWDAAVANRSLVLLEIANPGANGGLGLLVSEQDEAILSPPAGGPNTLYIGVAAAKTASWQPMYGFAQQEDAGGLIVATRYVSEAGSQPWRAVPSNYTSPALSALLAIEGAALPSGYGLKPGNYAVRAQGVTMSGDAGTPTSSVNVTVTRDNSAISASWTAPSSATGISHYRITVQDPEGVIRQQDTPDASTSYVIESLADWEVVSALPTAGTISPALLRAVVRPGDAATGTGEIVGPVRTTRALLGSWHEVDFGARHLPPQGEMADGSWPDWAVDFYGLVGGGAAHNMSIDAMHLDSMQSGMTLWYPGMNLSTKRVWVAEVRADGSVTAWLEDGSGNYVGSVLASGALRLGPGDALVNHSCEQAGGVSVLDAAQFTTQITLLPVADWVI